MTSFHLGAELIEVKLVHISVFQCGRFTNSCPGIIHCCCDTQASRKPSPIPHNPPESIPLQHMQQSLSTAHISHSTSPLNKLRCSHSSISHRVAYNQTIAAGINVHVLSVQIILNRAHYCSLSDLLPLLFYRERLILAMMCIQTIHSAVKCVTTCSPRKSQLRGARYEGEGET